VQYGTSLIFTHEILGISSYVITYTLLSTHIIDLSWVVSSLEWTAADFEKYHIDLDSKIVTFAMTVAIVKSLDVMGLVPLRWGLTILLTPYVARFIGPGLDRIAASLKKLLKPKGLSGIE